MENIEKIRNSCALSGHRKIENDFSAENLKNTFLKLIREENVSIFYCGMAIGFDLIACDVLCKLRDEYPALTVVACVPCPEQSAKFGIFYKREYERLLSFCNKVIVTSDHYSYACMHIRNRYMVDRAAFLVAYCNKNTGGTASTVRYAEKKGRKIIFV